MNLHPDRNTHTHPLWGIGEKGAGGLLERERMRMNGREIDMTKIIRNIFYKHASGAHIQRKMREESEKRIGFSLWSKSRLKQH